jgi:hypothetical protein
VNSIVSEGIGDYSIAFKLLGFLVYLAEEGPESFLAGSVLSPRTYYRWIEALRSAGLEELALDARMRELVRDYVWMRFGGLPIHKTRANVLEVVGSMIGEEEARSLQAISRQSSARVQGKRSEAVGREAEPSALDANADGGSMREATAPSAMTKNPRPVIRGCNVQDLFE